MKNLLIRESVAKANIPVNNSGGCRRTVMLVCL
jgi:hypothetical protein